MTRFVILEPDGTETVLGEVSQADMLRCPFCIIDFEHYRPDGSCRCDDPVEQERMIKVWGYTLEDIQTGLESVGR